MAYNNVTIHNAKIDDPIMQSLNNFALMLNYGDNYPYEELHEVKNILNQAFLDYQKLSEILAANNIEKSK